MSDIPRMQSVMSPMPHSIAADESLIDAHERMQQYRVRHLPVIDGGRLVGLVSDSDLRYFFDPMFHVPPLRKIGEVMTRDPFVVGVDEPLDGVLLRLAEERLGCVLVTDGPRVVGIFTTTDATRILGELLQSRRSAT